MPPVQSRQWVARAEGVPVASRETGEPPGARNIVVVLSLILRKNAKSEPMSSLPFARLQVSVLSRRGKWLISFRGKRAQFADRASAFREAIDQAYQCSKNGSPTDVIYVNEGLKRQAIWTYGIDPEPAGVGSGKHRLSGFRREQKRRGLSHARHLVEG